MILLFDFSIFAQQLKSFKDFFLFLIHKKRTGLTFLLMSLSLIFFPQTSYYETLQAKWYTPQVETSRFEVPPLNPYPQNTAGITPPELTARSVLVFDLNSSVKIFDKSPNLRLPPASTIKIMTALVSLDSFGLTDVLIVPKLADEGQDIKLVEGEKISAQNLLYALLVASANDAAETLAANYPDGREVFIVKMNEKAKTFYLTNTQFVNPTGLDQDGQYTSAFDLAMLGKRAMNNATFAKIVATRKIAIQSEDGKKMYQMENINQLLGKVEGVQGIKTGWTDEAGECLVSYLERDGHKVIIVVLGSKDRFGETEKLVNWVFESFKWMTPEITN